VSATGPTPRARAAATGRPTADPACAGCAQLGLLRALRRAGLAVQGGLGCEPPAAGPAHAPHVRVTGAREVLAAGPGGGPAAGARDGAVLAVVADRLSHGRLASVERWLARDGVPTVRLDPADLAATEAAVRRARREPGAVLLSFAPCVRARPRAAPLEVDPARCNRCGACLSLACPALHDPGGEGVAVDPSICTGCGLCLPLCRSGALAAPRAASRAAASGT
jgi:NAD-dependent dihydropyrimidine dehydrogenase PreA subunit